MYDREYLIALFGGREFPNGEFAIDYIEELMEYQKAFMTVLSEIRNTQIFTFPIMSISLIRKDGKFLDEDFAKYACEKNMKWNDYNFLFSEDPNITSQCCRIVNNPKDLKGFVNSIGGSALNIGSVQVNTINLAKIAYESEKNEENYLKILKDRVLLSQQVLDVIRHIIKRNVEKGLLKNYVDGCININKQFCTIGLNAMFEAIEYFEYIEEDEFGYKKYSDKGIMFAGRILDKINEWKEEFDCDYSWNVEAVPAENCARVLCRKDEQLFNFQRKRPLYSNQWIPLMEKCTIKEKLRLGSILDEKCNGGRL